ncbi:MAG: TAXI family TRAP transporter solute-binding subunit [Betaproteobacteria bacterium]|nr:TAXI family TRAP transporter solute-binding subunit [Betaproteobacteria bacterium]
MYSYPFHRLAGAARKLCILTAGATLALGMAGTAAAQAVAIATSGPGSIYHSSGSVIAKLLSDKAGVKATIQPFASPNVFVPSVDSGEIQLGTANIAELTWALQGEEYFKGRPYRNLRGIGIMYPLRSAIFVRKDSDIKTLADLKGRPVVDGYSSQKVIIPLLEAMYATVGLTRKDMRAVQVPNVVGGADAFASGKTDMFFFAIGAAKPREVDAAVGGIRMLTLPNTPQALAAVQKHFPPGYIRLENPGPGNIGVLTPSYSLAYDALMFGSTKTPDDLAYKVAKTMYESAKEMGDAFPPFKFFDPKQMARSVGPLQYHPGAVKFFKEAGIWSGK